MMSKEYFQITSKNCQPQDKGLARLKNENKKPAMCIVMVQIHIVSIISNMRFLQAYTTNEKKTDVL